MDGILISAKNIKMLKDVDRGKTWFNPLDCNPYDTKQLEFLLNISDDLELAFAVYLFQINNHFLSSKLVDFTSRHAILFPKSTRLQLVPSTQTVLAHAPED